MSVIESRYTDGTYLASNPEWDRADAEWKAQLVERMLVDHGIHPRSICDYGCGSGDVLLKLRHRLPGAALTGLDVSPQLSRFWQGVDGLSFVSNLPPGETYDVMLMLDVFEHVRDPFTLLESVRKRASRFIFHIPLDLSAMSVLRGSPLMNVRHKVGHLHFYTKDLALETLTDCGYSVVEWRYTQAYASLQTHHTWKTRLAHLPRRLTAMASHDLSARLFGGETLLVLAS